MRFHRTTAQDRFVEEIGNRYERYTNYIEINGKLYCLRYVDEGGLIGAELGLFNEENEQVFIIAFIIQENTFVLKQFYALKKRQGFGTYMIKYAIDLAKKFRCKEFQIFANASSTSDALTQEQLEAFYQKQDYKGLDLILNNKRIIYSNYPVYKKICICLKKRKTANFRSKKP